MQTAFKANLTTSIVATLVRTPAPYRMTTTMSGVSDSEAGDITIARATTAKPA